MNRISIIQNFVDHYKYSKYLEIGTWKGESLLPLKCQNKIAVDPRFKIEFRNKLYWIIKNPRNLFIRYFEMTSDEFFKHKNGWLKKKGKQELIFIDGQHTFKASLSDVLNSLKHLHDDGTIVLHDCFPPNKAAATPADSIDEAEKMGIQGWKKEWCGDVWKTILYLKEVYKNELEVSVLNADYGLGIVRFCKNKNKSSPGWLNNSIDQDRFNKIMELDYDYLRSNQNLLELKEITPFSEILN